MRTNERPRRVRRTVIVVALLVVAGFMFIQVCADGGAMAAAYRTCECLGFEWQLFDRTPADGPRRTLCLGYVRSRTCYQFRTGPVVGCPGRDPAPSAQEAGDHAHADGRTNEPGGDDEG